ncbi:MAG: extracellular solute-binding protein [Cohaesibacter sp.]|nr:extracellular solute-binding protein [Cohaesibacter sp.]
MTLAPTMEAKAETSSIIVQSTTSTQNSGLLDYLLPIFEKKTGIKVHVVAVGTGQALKNARNGDGDVVLVHAKAAEEEFVAQGFGVQRHPFMYNDFVLVGPSSDPAKVQGMDDSLKALAKIAEAKALFVSRGDESGTHKKEKQLWAAAGVDIKGHSGTWYRESGSGMGASLNLATGLGAYILTDRATWLAFANKQDFLIHVAGDQRLFNQYGVILVHPDKHPHVKAKESKAFVTWLLSDEGQAAIAEFRLEGKQLFFPNAKTGQ